MKRNACSWSVCGLFMAVLATAGVCPAAETIRINGSGSALDMMKPIVAAYQKNNKDVFIAMERPLGSSGAVKALLAGVLDLVISSKPLKPEEMARGAQIQVYGKTPLVIITERNVHRTDITTKELEDMYTGKRTIWPSGERIRLVLRPRNDIDSEIMRSLSPAMTNAIPAALSRPGMIVAVTDPEAYATVARTPGGIGATGLSSIIVKRPQVISLTLNGVKASLKTLASGDYPLYKDIGIVTTPKTPSAAHKFIRFMLSPQGRAIAEKNGVLVSRGVATHK